MSNESQLKKIATEPEIGSNGVGQSASIGGGRANKISPAELQLTIAESQKVIAAQAAKIAELEKNKSQSSDITQLAQAIIAATSSKPAEAQPVDMENVNRSANFTNQRLAVDHQGILDAQEALVEFRNEPKKPISISKSLQATLGPSLAITVNGTRVSIPCDGKTYFINETHWEHAKERLAKVDALNANEDDFVEIS